jgi:hypothetical protein
MTAAEIDSSMPNEAQPTKQDKTDDFSKLPEHIRERERLNAELHRQMQAECKAKGIKTL